MAEAVEDVVKVLYDYSYSDDKGEVTIKAGDVYRLIEKTNEEWWQVYNPTDENGESFFVPAQYVEIVSEVSPWKALSDLDKTLLCFEVSDSRESPTPDYEDTSTRVGGGTTLNGDPSGDYVNLDSFRSASGIPAPTIAVNSKPVSPTPSMKSGVSHEILHGTIPPPLPEEGTYIKVLLEGLPWDIYKEHSAGRLFYVNRETKERAWKPPRKERSITPQPTPKDVERSGSLSSNSNHSSSISPSVSAGSLHSRDDVLKNYFYRAKLTDIGPGNKRKSKKNWNHTYVVLQGSNLIFYKDEKATNDKAGPYGRPESVISLQGSRVSIPSKDLTSKKNTMLLQVLSGGYYLLNCDSADTLKEWFQRMLTIANSNGIASVEPPIKEVEEKKAVVRSVSADDSKNIVGIRAKLRNFISGRPNKEELVKQGIIKDSVFGALLSELCDREKSSSPVPKFVHTCIQAVEARGVKHDGLYRVSGNMAQIQKLRYAVDKDESYNLYDEQWDIHVLTGSLKLFFRELKDPLFPGHMYRKFVDAISSKDPKDQLSAFKSAISNLPRCNYYTLKELFQHLRLVMQYSHENRMQAQNLAIVFGPTLMWHEGNAESLTVQTVYQGRVVEYILLKYTELFK